jgi:flagellar hook assembly protein FlgD
MIDLVRNNGGLVLTLSEAVQYFRSRSTMQNVDGDYVWVPDNASPVEDLVVAGPNLRNYPNPFNPWTRVQFGLEEESRVEISIVDIRGRNIAVLAREAYPSGQHSLGWDGRDVAGNPVPAGVYFIKLKVVGGKSYFRKILLLK